MSAWTVSGSSVPADAPRFAEHAHELLRVERVAARALEKGHLGLRRKHGTLEEG